MEPTRRTPNPPCVGCLDNHQCWVCLGAGRCERASGVYEACGRCSGTGRCYVCQPASVDLTVAPQLPRAAADGPLRLDDDPPLRLDADGMRRLSV